MAGFFGSVVQFPWLTENKRSGDSQEEHKMQILLLSLSPLTTIGQHSEPLYVSVLRASSVNSELQSSTRRNVALLSYKMSAFPVRGLSLCQDANAVYREHTPGHLLGSQQEDAA